MITALSGLQTTTAFAEKTAVKPSFSTAAPKFGTTEHIQPQMADMKAMIKHNLLLLLYTVKKYVLDFIQSFIRQLQGPQDKEILHQSQFLQLVRKNNTSVGHPWEFVQRANNTPAVVIVPVIGDKVVLIEQDRPPVEEIHGFQTAGTIEFPAGLIGDEDGMDDTDPETAAQRELTEETGYAAQSFEYMASAATSPGLTDELVHYVKAEGLTKVSDKLGVGGERIKAVYEIPLAEVDDWLAEQAAQGKIINSSVFSGLNLLRHPPALPEEPVES